jgi:hypothetical protein
VAAPEVSGLEKIEPKGNKNDDPDSNPAAEKDFEIHMGIHEKPWTTEVGVADTGHDDEENAPNEQENAEARGAARGDGHSE